MIILGTQVVSQLQRGRSQDEIRYARLLRDLSRDEIRVTIITPLEQLKSVIGRIRLSRQGPERDLESFRLLVSLLDYYAGSWKGRILPFDKAACEIFGALDSKIVQKIKSMDARIAALSLANNGTILSDNLRDFREVPGLSVESWSTS